MNERDLVDKMLTEGKISAKQAALLSDAILQSENKVRRIFQDGAKKRKQRETQLITFIVRCIIALGLAFLVANNLSLRRQFSKLNDRIDKIEQVVPLIKGVSPHD